MAQEVGCDHSTIDRILNEAGVQRYTSAQQASKPVILANENEEIEFETVPEAAQWLIDTNQTHSKSLRNVRQYLTRFIANKKSYLGYYIRYKE